MTKLVTVEEGRDRARSIARDVIVFSIGACAVLAFMSLKPSSASRGRELASFPVGVACAVKPSGVVQTHSGDTFMFRCVNPDGTSGVVTALGQLGFDHSEQPAGYDAVVDVTSPDLGDANSVISFDLSGDNGVATIGTETVTGPTVNNDQLNAIVRVP